MKPNLVLATFFVISFAIISTAGARGPGVGGGSFGSSPPGGGFGYQGPQFGYQRPAFGDSRTSTYGTSGNRTYGTASQTPNTGTVQSQPSDPGNKPVQGLRTESSDAGY